jgi:hypothetical protein
MKNPMKRLLTSLLLALLISVCCAGTLQAQAVTFKLLDYAPFVVERNPNGLFWGFGYEQNIGDRIAVSLEYSKSYNLDESNFETSYTYRDASGYGYGYSSLSTYGWSEISYHSKFFFTPSDDRAWYVSSGIGIRTFHHILDIYGAQFDVPYASLSQSIVDGTHTEDVTLIPVTLKLGQRGSIDGWFGDWFLGLSFIPGASGKLPPANSPYDKSSYLSLKGVSFVFGLNFGIGWAD